VQSAFTVQVPAHAALAPHRYGAQACVCEAGQWPAPSHPAARVATPPAQLAARQEVVSSGYAQAVRRLPSQAPPQAEPSESHAGRPFSGAPVAGEQVPARPGRSQASHCPRQAVSQQTPSTQWPLPHWASSPHATPGPSLGTQAPPEHQSAAAQSESEAQPPVPVQAVGPHTRGVQGWSWTGGHAPWPSQAAASVAVPAEHEGARQLWPSAG
jgi:hypothetical protein